MLKTHSNRANCDTIFHKGHYYDKDTFIKASWGTAYDTKKVIRVNRNKAKCH